MVVLSEPMPLDKLSHKNLFHESLAYVVSGRRTPFDEWVPFGMGEVEGDTLTINSLTPWLHYRVQAYARDFLQV